MVGLAQAYLALGHYTKAAQQLELALALLHPLNDRVREATVLGALGHVYLAAGQRDAGEDGEPDAAGETDDVQRDEDGDGVVGRRGRERIPRQPCQHQGQRQTDPSEHVSQCRSSYSHTARARPSRYHPKIVKPWFWR